MPPPRRSSAATRGAISAAAAAMFRERGFARSPVRDIAAAAQTDPALVIRHFGSKELLFLETMHLTLDAEPLLDVPLEDLGERLVALLLTLDEPRRGVVQALVRSSSEPQIAERLRATHEAAFVGPLRARLAGPDAEARARLAAAVVGGLLYALWVVGDEVLLATPPAELAERYGAVLQPLLTPPS